MAASRLGSIERRHRGLGGGGNLRAAVFGINDGLVSNASLIFGVAGASSDARVVLLTGVAGLTAGAFAMAAGEFVSVRSQRELFEYQIGLERARARRISRGRGAGAGADLSRPRACRAAEANRASPSKLVADPRACARHAGARGTRTQSRRARIAVGCSGSSLRSFRLPSVPPFRCCPSSSLRATRCAADRRHCSRRRAVCASARRCRCSPAAARVAVGQRACCCSARLARPRDLCASAELLRRQRRAKIRQIARRRMPARDAARRARQVAPACAIRGSFPAPSRTSKARPLAGETVALHSADGVIRWRRQRGAPPRRFARASGVSMLARRSMRHSSRHGRALPSRRAQACSTHAIPGVAWSTPNPTACPASSPIATR